MNTGHYPMQVSLSHNPNRKIMHMGTGYNMNPTLISQPGSPMNGGNNKAQNL